MYYGLTQFQLTLAVILCGLIAAIILLLGHRALRQLPPSKPDDVVDEFGEVSEGRRPIPAALYVVYALIILWAIGYTLAVAAGVLTIE